MINVDYYNNLFSENLLFMSIIAIYPITNKIVTR